MVTNAHLIDAIFNAGERLIPGETHDRAEIVRHKSSYQLFRHIIEADILDEPSLLKTGIRILDIGCGTGHGTFMLGSILGAKIVGIDPSIESIQYARENYHLDNIEYVNMDAEAFVRNGPSFDYVVSRHALEHVVDGLNFALKVVCKKRLMVNVPFNESEGNVHHKVHWIKESNFELYPNKEFFYEGLDGITVLDRADENPPNSIVCISSVPDIRAVRDLVEFPFPCWQPEFLQELGVRALETDINRRCAWVVEKESQLSNYETNLRAREAGLNQRVADFNQHESDLNQRVADFNQHEAALNQRVAGFNQCETYLNQRVADFNQHEADLNQRVAGFNQCETDLNQRVADFNQHEADLNQHEADLNQREADLNQREADLNQREADFNQRKADLNQREAIIVNSLCGKVSRIYRRLVGRQ